MTARRLFRLLRLRIGRSPPGHAVERRALRGGMTVRLGSRSQENARALRSILWAAIALVLFQVQAGFLAHAGPEVVRIDFAVLLVVFCALHLGAIEGALAAFLIGYVADLFVQGPPGLCRFLSVAVWTTVRISSVRIHLGPLVAPIVFGFGAAALFQLGILFGLELVAEDSAGPGTIAWVSVVPQAAVTAAFALPLHLALSRLERMTTGRET